MVQLRITKIPEERFISIIVFELPSRVKPLREKEEPVSTSDSVSNITYFRYSGQSNTLKLLELAKERAKERGMGTIVVASETGRSANKASEIFVNTGIKLVVMTHYPDRTFGPKGEIPIGLNRNEYRSNKEELTELNIDVVQGTRPFVPPSRVGWTWNSMEGMIDRTLELFGSGTKIAVEVALMATDGGKVERGEEIISCGGTFKGLDTSLLVKTTYSHKFLDEFEIREIIAKPRYLVHADGQYMDENWKGDLDQYHE